MVFRLHNPENTKPPLFFTCEPARLPQLPPKEASALGNVKESTWPASRLVEGVITPTPPGKCVPHTCLCLCSGTKTIALSIEISASNSVSNENTSNAGEDEKQEVPGSTSGAGSTGPWAARPLPGHWQGGVNMKTVGSFKYLPMGCIRTLIVSTFPSGSEAIDKHALLSASFLMVLLPSNDHKHHLSPKIPGNDHLSNLWPLPPKGLKTNVLLDDSKCQLLTGPGSLASKVLRDLGSP
ncbi:uncharacterized protein LOC119870150 isoform X3 [Canis lupus familiaris]|uniref:uncharacterized protein LOC119870150 isoform X3 n=1 Tax=Canis lupus familiaris TaxID=9615 RepID=UPI0018F639B0|nr:uncharacterized protein LOC119870150 isoform X3 [Canis lupus familiaris]